MATVCSTLSEVYQIFVFHIFRFNCLAPSTRQYNNSKTAAGIINRRRGLTNAFSSGTFVEIKKNCFDFTTKILSAVNLSSLGQDDSSSEEAQSIPPTNGKPAVPPRPRSISVDHKRNGGIPGMVPSVPKPKPHNYEELPTKDIDVDSADCKNRSNDDD